MKVLFADDCPSSADAFAVLAKTMGHEAFVAYDGQNAVALARAATFDLIVLDIRLGDADGRDVCASIRREGYSRDSQILAITGHIGLEQDVSLGTSTDTYRSLSSSTYSKSF